MTASLTPKPADWLSILALGFLWGSSFMAAKIALADFGPLTLAAARIVLGAVLLLAVVALTGRSLPRRARAWGFVLAFAVFSNALPFFLLNWAQLTVPSSFAGIMQATVPFFVLPLAIAFVPGETFGWGKLAGLLVGFLGVVILIGPGELVAGPAAVLPRLACVGAALCYALGGLVTRLAPKMDQIAYSAAALAVAGVLSTPAALWVEGVPEIPGAASLTALAFLAAGPTALAALLLVRTIRSAGPTFVTLVNYMVPVWSVLLGVLLLAEALPGSFFWAMALILVGLTLSQFSALQQLVHGGRKA
ncbi:MAG: DMT family transporter [Alphaproteobacteria bacterium]|nr:DMT family transporter [Alphaproteobacteria bacterium]